MRDLPPDLDAIDAVLGDDVVVEDLTLLAAVVHDIRSEFRISEPLRRSSELSAFTDPVEVDAAVIPHTRRARRGLQAAGLGLAGKVLLGTTLAAASVGGLGAADLIELPTLPDQAADQALEVRPETINPGILEPAAIADDTETPATESSPPAEAPGAAVSEAAHAKRDLAAEFVIAAGEWRMCAQGLTGPEREATCGERPHPADFGLTEPPGQLARPEVTSGVGNGAGNGGGAITAPGQNPAANTDHPPGPPVDVEVGRP